MAKVYDSATGITTTYYYDLTGRLVKYTENGTGHSFTVAPTYDSKNLATYVYEETNGYGRNTWYTYDDDNRLKSTQKGWVKDAYAYDPYGRLYYKWLSYKSTLLMETGYTFVNGNDTTSNQVATLQMDAAGYDVTYSYTYDKNGNITSISDGTYTISYEYDSINQLVRENNQAGGFTHTWEYDNAGNISKRKEYAYTTEENLSNITPTDIVKYDYGNSQWGDLLTVYDGTAISYDNVGNPQSDGTWNYTWEHGRQLASMSKTGTTWNYAYGEDGMRTQRTDGTTTYKYYYDGGQLLSMTVGDKALYFGYSNGSPMSVVYENDVTYYYVTNLQGDVVAILDGNGNQVVGYTYDAWGNLLSTTGTMAATLGADNPLRYRGYVYDRETGLYYLQSRYYDPEMGRFLNTDSYAATGQGFVGNNMFAYCLNNPVMYKDETGSVAVMTAAATAGVAISAQALLPVAIVVLAVVIFTDPNIQNAIADGFECVTTTVRSWTDELEETITNTLSISLTKTAQKQEKKYHVHHIVAQSDSRAVQSRWILTYLFDSGVNDSRNLITVEDRIHQRLHTNAYFLLVEHIIVDAFWSAQPYKQAQTESVEKALAWLKVFIGGLSALS